MHHKTNTYYLNLLRSHKDELRDKYGVSRIGIFGSVAREMHHSESDIDICIEMPTPDMMAFVGVYSELEHLLGTKVDIVRMSKYTNPILKKRIEREAIYV
ncbi:MAG: nucleotidyltransferase family protein [Bacteroidales bacterium]|nr:nucleotidyltransferase family protein [Bacteroidales bacterium]